MCGDWSSRRTRQRARMGRMGSEVRGCVSLAVALTSRKRWGWVVCMCGCGAWKCVLPSALSAKLLLTSRSSLFVLRIGKKTYAGRKSVVAQVAADVLTHSTMTASIRAFGRRCLLSLSLLCDGWNVFGAFVVVLDGWADGATSAGSHQGLACKHFLLPTCMYALMPTRPGVGVLYSREATTVWHLQACIMRRRSTGEDER